MFGYVLLDRLGEDSCRLECFREIICETPRDPSDAVYGVPFGVLQPLAEGALRSVCGIGHDVDLPTSTGVSIFVAAA